MMTSTQRRNPGGADVANPRIGRRKLITTSAAGLATHAVASGTGRTLHAQENNSAAVVSSRYLATNAGIDILNAGGTAADAAVAVAAVLTVVEPYFSSMLGGGTWALYYDAESGEVTSMDGVGPAGSLATLEDYRERSEEPGIHQAIVPGAWDGWMLWLQNYGQLGLPELLAPAIALARDGFEASAQMRSYLERDEEMIRSFPDTAATWLVNDVLPEIGDTITLPNLADTLQGFSDVYEQTDGDHIAKVQAARDHFYRGPIAESLVAHSEENGGYYTLEDFAEFEAEILPSISINYRGRDVHQSPPNSQGIAMLLALNILKGFDLTQVEAESADAIHVQVEAIKLAYADRHHMVGDPDFADIPLEELLSDEYGRSQLERIDLANAMEWPIESELGSRADSHTTTFHIVDHMGNAAAVTTSLGFQFLVAGETGIHINERNRFFSLDENNPNAFAPGKKVRHTSCPYMVLQGGLPIMLGGNTGVDTQPQGQMQQFMNVTDFGFTAQQAIDQPRYVSTAFPASTVPNDFQNTLQMEEGFPEETIERLTSRGHEIDVGSGIYGSAHMIVINQEDGSIEVGTESRADDPLGEII